MSRFQQNVKICPFITPLLAVLLKFAVILTILWLIMQFQNQLYLLHMDGLLWEAKHKPQREAYRVAIGWLHTNFFLFSHYKLINMPQFCINIIFYDCLFYDQECILKKTHFLREPPYTIWRNTKRVNVLSTPSITLLGEIPSTKLLLIKWLERCSNVDFLLLFPY